MGAVNCRGTVRRGTHVARVAIVAGLVGAWFSAPPPGSGATGATTPTTLPGAAPNQSQINATTSQVAQIEGTLAQQTSILDDKYNTAVQSLQDAQSSLQTIATNLVHEKAAVVQDKRLVANDAVQAYVYGTPETGFASYFSSSATQNQARNQYTNAIVGNLTKDELALEHSQAQLQAEQAQQQTVPAGPDGGNPGQDVGPGQRGGGDDDEIDAQPGARATGSGGRAGGHPGGTTGSRGGGPRRRAVAAQQQAAAAAATAATVAGAVGGASSGAAATDAANQAGASGPVGGSASGGAGGMAAVQAAVSQLGVPYVFGGEAPGVGFDCSGLVQWAWAQAGVSIPRTTETEWPALSHVSLDALQPGDLLFYYNLDGDNQVDHVVMFTGSGPYGTDTVIQAPFTGSTVSYSPIFTEGLIGAARP